MGSVVTTFIGKDSNLIPMLNKINSSAGFAEKAIKKMGVSLRYTANVSYKAAAASRTFEARMARLSTKLQGVGKSMMNFRRRFAGWALSVMFFGMMIQRVFMGILRKSFKVFNDVMQTTEGAISNITMLGASFQYLGFTIGSAINQFLGPLMPMLTRIIMTLAEWVEKNPDLTAKILLWGLAIGTALMVIGQLWLGVTGLLDMLWKLGGIFTWIGGKILPFINIIKGPVVAALAIVWGAFRIISGFLEGDWWRIVSGIFLAIGGIVALIFGGWIPLAIIGVIAILTWLGDRFKWVRVIFAGVAAGVVGLIEMAFINPFIKAVQAVGWLGKAIAKVLGKTDTFWDKLADFQKDKGMFDMAGATFKNIMDAPTKEERDAEKLKANELAEQKTSAEENISSNTGTGTTVYIAGDQNNTINTEKGEDIMDQINAVGGMN